MIKENWLTFLLTTMLAGKIVKVIILENKQKLYMGESRYNWYFVSNGNCSIKVNFCND